MSDLRTRVGQVVTRQRTPVRATLWAALVFSFLVLIVATHVKLLRPAVASVGQARDLYAAKRQRAALEAENARLRDILTYLQTPSGRDLVVRGKVYAVRPGERLILVQETAKPAPPPPPTWAERLWQYLERQRAALAAGMRQIAFVSRAMIGQADAPTRDKAAKAPKPAKASVQKTVAVTTE